METLIFETEVLGKRESFNKVVNLAKSVIEIVGELESNYNLADILNEFIEVQKIENSAVCPIINSLLIDKYKYQVKSFNLENTLIVNLNENINDFKPIVEELSRWKAVDIVMTYFHPELGVKVINPKSIASWELVKNIKKNELLNIYLGSVKGNIDEDLIEVAFENCILLLKKEKVKNVSQLYKGSILVKERKKPKPKEVSPAAKKATKISDAGRAKETKTKVAAKTPSQASSLAGQKRMTPFYSIPVTNELFHNGNVEAWKKIIESYTAKYPDNEVYIFYEGERIHDINSLFKWGKVKHGSVILIALAGTEIKDLPKLQRYLRQGASPMFEAFLKFPVNQVLNLF